MDTPHGWIKFSLGQQGMGAVENAFKRAHIVITPTLTAWETWPSSVLVTRAW